MKRFIILLMVTVTAITSFSQSRHVCAVCGGRGVIYCTNCGGYGYVLVPVYNPYYGTYVQTRQVCSVCAGYRGTRCSYCNGKGYVTVYNPSFTGSPCGDGNPPNSQSDGFIYQGRSVKYKGRSYKLYHKSGHSYVYDRCAGWIQI